MKLNNSFKLILALLIAQLAGIIGSIFTIPAIPGWYASLTKPALTPPAWIFAPVWTILFLLMGLAAFLIWKRGFERQEVKYALWLFIGQLILNVVWSAVFFGWQNPGAALMEIIVLWLAILSTIIAFAKVSKAAAWLLAPYLLWVGFAGYLNYFLWALN